MCTSHFLTTTVTCSMTCSGCKDISCLTKSMIYILCRRYYEVGFFVINKYMFITSPEELPVCPSHPFMLSVVNKMITDSMVNLNFKKLNSS